MSVDREAMLMRLGLGRSWAHAAFLSSGGAAAIHFAATPSHLEEWAPAGAFMLACGIAQLAWAWGIVSHPRAGVAAAGVALHAATIGLWLITRTIGLPFGPHAGVAEHVHATDALATSLEALAATAALAIVAQARPRSAFAVLAGLAAALAVFTTSHQPARESATAAAAMMLLMAGRTLVVSVPRREEGRRNDVWASLVRRCVVGVRDTGRPRLGHSR